MIVGTRKVGRFRLKWLEDGENDLLELEVKRWIERVILKKMAMYSKVLRGL
jgi:hypothetical protein